MADDVKIDVRKLSPAEYEATKHRVRIELLRLAPRYAEPIATVPLPPRADGTLPTTVGGLSHQAYLQAKKDVQRALRTPKA